MICVQTLYACLGLGLLAHIFCIKDEGWWKNSLPLDDISTVLSSAKITFLKSSALFNASLHQVFLTCKTRIKKLFNSLIDSPNMLASTMLHTIKNTTCTKGFCSNLDFHLIYKDGHGSVKRSNTTITTYIHKYDLTLGLFNFFVLNYIYTHCYFVRLRYVHNFKI